MAGHTYHGSCLRALSPQVEACSGCMHCSGKPSNRTKLPDTMGNRRHFPTPGLPNPVATSLGEERGVVAVSFSPWTSGPNPYPCRVRSSCGFSELFLSYAPRT